MNDLPATDDVVVRSFEVRQFEAAQFPDRGVDRFAPRTTALGAPLASQGAQHAQHLRPIEPLTLTVLAKAHGSSCHGYGTRAAHRGGAG